MALTRAVRRRFLEQAHFSGTVDQFLAFLQYAYGPMCLLPVLADSVVVIDEVHSFDDKMFAALKKFLRVLRRSGAVHDGHAFGDAATRIATVDDRVRVGKTDRLAGDRRRPPLCGSAAHQPARGRGGCRRGAGRKQRVLWVVNKVRVAQEVARQFGTVESVGGSSNRRWRTRAVLPLAVHPGSSQAVAWARRGCIQADGRRKSRAVLAVTTQVCEMSLDLDADVLITEEAPITAIIQRMGRCNRKNGCPRRSGKVYVYPPEDPEKPYARRI